MVSEREPPRLGQRQERNSAPASSVGWTLAGIAVLAGAVGVATWWWNREAVIPPAQRVESVPGPETPPPVPLPKLPFKDVTEAAAVTFRHENGAAGEKLMPETMGGGCAFFDFDNDGDEDLLFVNSARWPGDDRPHPKPASMELYQNDGRGRFQNVTAGSGLDVSFYGMGAAVGDYDGDGLVDVFISAVGRNHLFRNLAWGRFEEVTEATGTAGEKDAWSTSCGWFDYDRDGDLDLLVLNYIVWSRELDLAQDFRLEDGRRAYGRPQVFEGTFPYLYRNEGGGDFTEVAEAAGLFVRDPKTKEPMAKSLGLAFADLDDDGWPDFIVANDTVQNFVFHNLKDGRFEEIGVLTGIAFDRGGDVRGAMGIDVGKFRNDGSLGIAIGNFANEMTALYVSREGQLGYTDEAVHRGLKSTWHDLTFGVFYFDPDLDGRLDLFAANGHLEPDIQQVLPHERYKQPPQLLWNCGKKTRFEFWPLTEASTGTDLLKARVGRGAAYADIDGDGDQDVLITTSGGRPRLLRNDQNLGHHWVRFRLQGTRANRDAIGAWINLTLPDGRVLSRQVMPTRSYLSQVELPVTFGLVDFAEIPRTEISWPDGTKQVLGSLKADQLHHIVQPEDEELKR